MREGMETLMAVISAAYPALTEDGSRWRRATQACMLKGLKVVYEPGKIGGEAP